MATINLGSIKFNWKGAYNGATAYAVDDVVSSGGSSYVCILASTGNATSNGTYWEQMSSAGTNGTNGSDGTDVGTTLTTAGDILYRDGSGLQRLPKGTADQVLKMNAGATAPEYGTLSSDYVKLYGAEDISAFSGGHSFNGFFDNTKYSAFRIIGADYNSSNGGNTFLMRARTGTNGATENSNNEYYSAFSFISATHAGTQQKGETSQFGNSARIGWNGGGSAASFNTFDMLLSMPDDSHVTHAIVGRSMWDNSYFGHSHGAWVFNASNTPMTGIKFFHGGGSIGFHYINIYGLKK